MTKRSAGLPLSSLLSLALLACAGASARDLPLDLITLPDGFEIDAGMLEKYRFFRRLGMFGVEQFTAIINPGEAGSSPVLGAVVEGILYFSAKSAANFRNNRCISSFRSFKAGTLIGTVFNSFKASV